MKSKLKQVGKSFRGLVGMKGRRIKHAVYECECGRKFVCISASVSRGLTSSCGCSIGDRHGMRQYPVYRIWSHMKGRCNNVTDAAYGDYGGRGIKLCDRWDASFMNFYRDMGSPPEGGTIDRIDNSKGYSPENCRWSTRKEQARNRRSNVYLTVDGVTKLQSDWVKELGMSTSTIQRRRKKGWTERECVMGKVRVD